MKPDYAKMWERDKDEIVKGFIKQYPEYFKKEKMNIKEQMLEELRELVDPSFFEKYEEVLGNMRSREVLEDFENYCFENPEGRFWQNLRNWSEFTFIFGSKDSEGGDLKDTFYFEGKND